MSTFLINDMSSSSFMAPSSMLSSSLPSSLAVSLPASLQSSIPFSSSSSPPRDAVVSSSGIIHVLGYNPTEGEGGAPITVRIHFNPDFSEVVYIRLVFGHKAVATSVQEIQSSPYGRWELSAVAPPFDPNTSSSTKILMTVQVLNKDNAILDTVTFGEFSYWAPPFPEPAQPQKKPKLSINTSQTLSFRRRTISHLPTPSPTSPQHLRSASSSKSHHAPLHRRTKAESMIRPKNGKSSWDANIQTPILDLVTPLHDICTNWSPAEVSIGRRLVRFTKVQDGCRLIVSCEPVKVDDYRDSDSVISCIYREESHTCFVTSVDIIFLLERLTSNEFPVEEKNRIRRNLEGLRPTTVSKHKEGFEDFFQRIMEFPEPKPRNIEKDLKVFEWTLLGQALDKILSKYAIDTSIVVPVNYSEFSAEPSPQSGSEEPEYTLSYPEAKADDVYIDEPTSAASVLPSPTYESGADELQFLTASDGSGSLCSPLDTASAAYSLYHHGPPSGSSTDSWGGQYKQEPPLAEHYSGYDVVPAHAVQALGYSSEIDFGPYDTLPYHGSIPLEMDIVEHPYV